MTRQTDSAAPEREPTTAKTATTTGPDAHGRHASAVAVLERALDPVITDMGFELLLLEWLASGKRRILRVYLDHPKGVTVADCSQMSRIVGNTLDAAEAAAAEAGQTGEAGDVVRSNPALADPALLALLDRPYNLEVSSPGVDRPLTRRRHFEAQVGGRVKLELWEALAPEEGGDEADHERKFHGRIAGVEADPEAPDDQRRGVVVVHDSERGRTLRVPLPRVRRANLVWEF